MDPIGFSLDNFDLIGTWRASDSGEPIDATGQLVDGTKLERARQPAKRAVEPLGRLRPHRHRKTADLCHRPRAQILRYAGGSLYCARCRQERQSFFGA
jgi:hypothetical protein